MKVITISVEISDETYDALLMEHSDVDIADRMINAAEDWADEEAQSIRVGYGLEAPLV